MSDPQISPISSDAIDKVHSKESAANDVSLDSLILLINAERLKHLQNQTEKEFEALKNRQKEVSALHDAIKAINAAIGSDGSLDLMKNPQLKDHLETAKNLGVDMKEGQTKFTKEEQERLIENFRMTIEDKNVENDMQLQTVSRLTNERYESYQLLRAILKPLHEMKLSHAKAARGG